MLKSISFLRYLKQYRKVRYYNLLTSGKLNGYLANLDRQVEEMFSRLVKQLAEKEGVTEAIKAENQMLWVQKMNSIRNANNLQNGGIYYYFDTKEEIVLACAEEAISRIEQGAFSIALEDIKDVANMMNHLGTLADELSPVMRFLVSVCVSQEYGNKVKPYLVQLAGRYPYYTKKIAEILGCTAAEVEPYVHLSILALNNYMIFNERALFLPQIEAAKKGLMQLAKRKG